MKISCPRCSVGGVAPGLTAPSGRRRSSGRNAGASSRRGAAPARRRPPPAARPAPLTAGGEGGGRTGGLCVCMGWGRGGAGHRCVCPAGWSGAGPPAHGSGGGARQLLSPCSCVWRRGRGSAVRLRSALPERCFHPAPVRHPLRYRSTAYWPTEKAFSTRCRAPALAFPRSPVPDRG